MICILELGSRRSSLLEQHLGLFRQSESCAVHARYERVSVKNRRPGFVLFVPQLGSLSIGSISCPGAHPLCFQSASCGRFPVLCRAPVVSRPGYAIRISFEMQEEQKSFGLLVCNVCMCIQVCMCTSVSTKHGSTWCVHMHGMYVCIRMCARCTDSRNFMLK
jgi:hypothetical protein